jgi:hypothetical protein
MLLKNRTPLFIALVAFVTMFVFQIAIRVLNPPPNGRMPLPMDMLIYAISSGVVAWLVWADRRKALKRPTAARKWAHWLGLLLLVILACLIYRFTFAFGAQ